MLHFVLPYYTTKCVIKKTRKPVDGRGRCPLRNTHIAQVWINNWGHPWERPAPLAFVAWQAYPAYQPYLAYSALVHPTDWLRNRGRRSSGAPGEDRTWGQGTCMFEH